MTVDTTSIAAGLESVRAQITGAIKQAANATGASFEYLLSAAKIESNLNPTAAASTSSARGLYQFIEQTWLGTVKEAGPMLGFGKYADAISKSDSGTYSVSDPAARNDILKLRDDPAINAAMAGVLTQSNSFKLTGQIGRRPTDGELYIAHFMGVGGASKLINAAENNPRASAAGMFPNAAAANQPIFYDRSGNARSVSEVYSVLTSRYANAANSQTTRAAIAALGAGSGAPPAYAAAASDSNAFYLSGFPQAQQAASSQQAGGAQAGFRALFQAGDRSEPVSPAVRTLWGNGASITADPAPASAAAQSAQGSAGAPAVGRPRPFDLFSDRSGLFSS
ncbi:lytic transglycosylase domain-containing protein [Bradyrhizobium prioriisuperbiae]|uniref:lytic transglycosylase domain-containing protein n=1 Tax=Bradyrhizobium prioriisuperbiae TaxID=2854389 RepID=UPI0028E20D35|nr:lytic transglycosylase domain-containing protein [Bradyrhizobium prioritasuperba]